MKKNVIYAVTLCLTLGLLAACGPSSEPAKNTPDTDYSPVPTLTLRHELGTATAPLNPKKVAVFDMGTLDILNELGVETRVAIPNDIVTSYLSRYKNNTRIGAIKEPDLEGLYTFKPDVIFISGRQRAYYPELAKIAPTVYVQVRPDHYLDDLDKNVTGLGKLFGKKTEAKRQMADLQERIAEAKAVAAGHPAKALILLTNDGSISAYGKGSRFGLIHDIPGIAPADDAIQASIHGQQVGYEYLARVNPDILYVVDRTTVVGGTRFANATLDNDLVKNTRAARNGKIVNMDAESGYLTAGRLTATKKMIDDAVSGLKN